MRSIIAMIFLAMCVNTGSAVLLSRDKADRMKKYNTEVRTGVEMLWAGMEVPPAIVEHCDSLSYLLYVDTVSVPLAVQVISRLSVETFNLVSENDKTDYHQIVVALNSCKNSPAFYDKFFLASSMGLGEYKLSQLDGEQALAAFSLALKCMQHESNRGVFDVFYPYIDLNIAYAYSIMGQYDEAVKWQSRYAGSFDRDDAGVSDDYIAALSLLATYQQRGGMDLEALATYENICDKIQKSGRQSSDNYTEALLAIAGLKQTDEAYARLLEAVSDESEVFVEALSDATNYYHRKSDKASVLKCLDRVLGAVESGRVEAGILLNYLAYLDTYYVDSGYTRRFLELAEAHHDSSDMVNTAFLASVYAKCGDFAKSVEKATEVSKMADRALQDEDDEIALTFSSVVQMYSLMGDYDNAIKYLKLSLPYVEQKFSTISPEIIDENMKLLASFYALSGDVNESKQILESLLAGESVSETQKRRLLVDVIYTLHGAGDYEGVERYCEMLIASEPNPETLWEALSMKASALISWIDSSYEKDTDDYKDKFDELTRVVAQCRDIIYRNFDEDVEKRLYSKLYTATLNFLTGDDARMLEAADEAEAIIRMEMKSNVLSETYLSALAMYYIKAGDYRKAINLIAETPGDNDLEAIYTLQILAEAYLGLGEKEEARRLYGDMASRIMESAGRNFAMLTESDKEKYWRMYERQIADAGRYADEDNPGSEFGGVVYDLALNSKGMLLNATKSFETAVGLSEDPEVAELYAIWKNKRRIRADNLKISADEKQRLEKQIQDIELTLARHVAQSNSHVSDLRYKWTDVRDRLNPDDVAIEFLELQTIDNDRSYGAVIVSPALANPVIVKLGDACQIEDKIVSSFRASTLWKRLLPYMNPTGKTYFSAVGRLHCLPIESLLIEDDTPVSARYPLYRLSSTRELVTERKVDEGGIAIFGGIDYGNGVKTTEVVNRGMAFSLPYLPGTKEETDIVERLVRTTGGENRKIRTYQGLDGNETNFRKLSGSDMSIIHIGTHGYFLPSSRSGLSRLPLSARKLYKSIDKEDNPLVNSGLFLANANKGGTTDSTADDGIMTAYEIAELDFSGVDMMVLSACETGLGRVGSDGVFGLQRGLKMAGVNTILMTLEKVDDKITRDMMTEFYKRYLGGCSKKRAFEEARETIRVKYPDSRCWASFILLDALD